MVSGYRCRHNWRAHFIGEGVHAGGHTGGPDLLKIVHGIKSTVLIPVYSEPPGFYVKRLKNSGINVILPGKGKTINL